MHSHVGLLMHSKPILFEKKSTSVDLQQPSSVRRLIWDRNQFFTCKRSTKVGTNTPNRQKSVQHNIISIQLPTWWDTVSYSRIFPSHVAKALPETMYQRFVKQPTLNKPFWWSTKKEFNFDSDRIDWFRYRFGTFKNVSIFIWKNFPAETTSGRTVLVMNKRTPFCSLISSVYQFELNIRSGRSPELWTTNVAK